MTFNDTPDRKRSRKRRHDNNIHRGQSAKNGDARPSTLHGDGDPSGRDGPSGRSMTIAEFCKRHRIGKSTFYDLRARGLGPQEMRIGRTVRISSASNQEWVAKMEAGKAACVPPFEPKPLMPINKRRDDETGSRRKTRRREERDRVAASESLVAERRRKRDKTRVRRKRQPVEEYFALAAGPGDEGLDVEETIPQRQKKRSEKRQRRRSKRRNREA